MQTSINPQRTDPAVPADSSDAAPTPRPSGTPVRIRNALSALRLFVVMLAFALLSRFFVLVPAGERGVLMHFGAVQEQVLQEGLHPLLPLWQSVQLFPVRLQSLVIKTEAASRDLQDVNAELALNWHADAAAVNTIFQRLGPTDRISSGVIRPAIEDGIKAVFASFTAEQLVTERVRVKQAISELLAERLGRYQLLLDDVDLLQLEFSERFREAVEAKQVAEQEARRAEFEAIRAQREAAADVFRARGQAEAQHLLQATLSEAILEHEAIEKWNGHLPLVIGQEALGRFDFKSLIKADRRQSR